MIRNNFSQYKANKVRSLNQNTTITFAGQITKRAIKVLNTKSGELEKAVLKLEKEGNMHYVQIWQGKRKLASIQFSILNQEVYKPKTAQCVEKELTKCLDSGNFKDFKYGWD